MKRHVFILVAMIAFIVPAAVYSATFSQTALRVRSTSLKQIMGIPFVGTTTIAQLKEAIQESEGIPVEHQVLMQRIIVRGCFSSSKRFITLKDEKTCAHYGLDYSTELILVVQIRGG